MARPSKDEIHYLLLKLHSLTGIVPIGAFLVVHICVNSLRTVGVWPYQLSIDAINSIPFLLVVEITCTPTVSFCNGVLCYEYFQNQFDSVSVPTQWPLHIATHDWGYCFCFSNLPSGYHGGTQTMGG